MQPGTFCLQREKHCLPMKLWSSLMERVLQLRRSTNSNLLPVISALTSVDATCPCHGVFSITPLPSNLVGLFQGPLLITKRSAWRFLFLEAHLVLREPHKSFKELYASNLYSSFYTLFLFSSLFCLNAFQSIASNYLFVADLRNYI